MAVTLKEIRNSNNQIICAVFTVHTAYNDAVALNAAKAELHEYIVNSYIQDNVEHSLYTSFEFNKISIVVIFNLSTYTYKEIQIG